MKKIFASTFALIVICFLTASAYADEAELNRRIDILSEEIEKLKAGQAGGNPNMPAAGPEATSATVAASPAPGKPISPSPWRPARSNRRPPRPYSKSCASQRYGSGSNR